LFNIIIETSKKAFWESELVFVDKKRKKMHDLWGDAQIEKKMMEHTVLYQLRERRDQSKGRHSKSSKHEAKQFLGLTGKVGSERPFNKWGSRI